jgi:hypothetical protein
MCSARRTCTTRARDSTVRVWISPTSGTNKRLCLDVARVQTMRMDVTHYDVCVRVLC